MKNLQPIASLTLALLVLVSSTSFMVGIHFCSGKVQNIALFTKAEGCEMEKELPPCHRQMKTSCCDDETVIHEGEDFDSSKAEISIPATSFVAIAAPVTVLSAVIPDRNLTSQKFFYQSPHRAGDFIVSHRQLLI